jgi:hypothetical protein
MNREVFCTKSVCALDRLPYQQFGGGLRVQAAQYLIPLERQEQESPIETQFQSTGRKRKRDESLTRKNKQRRPAKKSLSTNQTAKK